MAVGEPASGSRISAKKVKQINIPEDRSIRGVVETSDEMDKCDEKPSNLSGQQWIDSSESGQIARKKIEKSKKNM